MWTVFRPFNHGFSLLYIRNFFPEKSIHPFTEWLFSSEYQRKKVWTLGLFKPSHSDWSLHTATQSFTKAARWLDRVRKKCDNYKMMLNRAFHFGNFRVNAWIAVWRLEKSKCSHRKPLIIICFNALCEGVNPFSGIEMRIRARAYEGNHPVKAWVKVMVFIQVPQVATLIGY